MNIRESVEYVLEQSAHVYVNMDAIKNFARHIDRNDLIHWLHVSPFDLTQFSEAEKLNFLFALDSMSFSYWGTPQWSVDYHGKSYKGTQAMIACLGRAVEIGIQFSPDYFANLQREDLENILQGNTEIPLLQERLKNLNEIGIVTQREFNGDFRYLIAQAQGDALKLVILFVNHFSTFEDSSRYKGRKIEFYKRAQLLASDISNMFGQWSSVDALTACADYRLPQVLRRHNILHYSDKLQKRIMQGEEISAGSEEEVEIRAHTIHAVELIKHEVGAVTSSQINDYIWLAGQVKLPHDEPHHLTRTTSY